MAKKAEKRSNELYISVDVETDGPAPGINSMLSFGAVAIRHGKIVGAFYANLLPLANATQDPRTMREFWDKNPDAWDHIHSNPKYPQLSPLKAMRAFDTWLESFGKRPICVAYPAGFDFTFIYWYLIAFLGRSPLGFSAIDIKSYAMSETGMTFRDTCKKNMPRHWFAKELRHTHCALDDALEQGVMWMNILGMDTSNLDLSIVNETR